MTQDVKNLGDAGLQGIQLPTSIYIGKNVVRRHVLEFYKLAAAHKLLAQGAQVLAVFDCVVLEQHGGRLGSFTLHDYAVLTTTNLITWGRGQNRDLVDRFEWSDVVLEKFGRRSPLEGMVKVSNRTRSAVSKRRIAVRTKNENVDEPIPQFEGADKETGITLYLDLMPFDDVRTCASMIYFLSNKGGETPGIDAFNAKFKSELAESTERLTTIANAMKSFYVQQANGVWIEKGYTEETEMLERLSASAASKEESNKNKDSKLRRGYVSPYKLGKGGVAPKTRTPVATPKVAALPKVTSVSKTTSSADEDWFYSDFGKLDKKESSQPVASAISTPAPKPAPTPRAATPVRSAKPAVRPTPAPKVAKVKEEKPVVSKNERTVAMPFGVSLGMGALNLFTFSRIIRGLWLDPRTLGLRISGISGNSALLMDLFGTVATDADARQNAINRLRSNIDNGPIAKNVILHYTIYPFLKPVLDAVASPEIDRVIRKVKVRAVEQVAAPVKNPVESKPIATTAKVPVAKPVEAPKPVTPVPVVEAVKPVEAPKPAEAPKPVTPAPVVEAAKKVEPPKPVEAPKPVTPVPVVEAVKPVEAPKPAEAPKPVTPALVVEATKKVEPPKPAEAPKPVASAPTVAAVKPVEAPKPAEAPKPVTPAPVVEAAKKVEPPKPAEAPKPVTPAPVVEAIKKVEPPKPAEAPKPVTPAPTVAFVKPVEAPKPITSSPVVDAAKKAMEAKPNEATSPAAKTPEKPKVEEKLPVQQPPKVDAAGIEGTDATTKINISAPKVTDPTASLGKEDEKPPEPSKLDKI
ncbi:MAG: hypothetical protein HXX08_04915 [Chloroflexi bacterium]|uniref:Uncharacterized protein n=1 Tax=Candidatus Chlorohelix allophototropha TaxID=3003348 RepID=A0A8T7LT63_9CHLR|nr:hypothetical protein [Chloroflexota bacterium]WJW67082.1 hypothetical protein OZ401_000331 [Chloroflexota bacterium L227-S17]